MREPLKLVFYFLFLQMIALTLTASVTQQPLFAIRPGPIFGWDYHAFYWAAHAWLHGENPYSVVRPMGNSEPGLVTPPGSIIVGVLFSVFSFEIARLLFMVMNIGLVVFTLVKLSAYLKLSTESRNLLVLIAIAYYPFILLIQRGNIDGVVMASLVFACIARRSVVRVLLLAFAISIKLYPTLLLAVLVVKRRVQSALAIVATTAILLLPFIHYLSSFATSLSYRITRYKFSENISPAILFSYSGVPGWKYIFFAFWLITLIITISRDHSNEPKLLTYTPWLVSMPTELYEYSAVFYLPLLAVVASNAKGRVLSTTEKLFIAGFLFTCIQSAAFASIFYARQFLWELAYLCTPVGCTLMLLSACAGVFNQPCIHAEATVPIHETALDEVNEPF